MTKTKILIVEDEVIVARDIREQLLDLGYEPVADTATGEEALDLIAQTRPDLVLMDVHLAGEMDGIAAAQILRDRFAVPVIFLTAYTNEETLRRAKITEPFGYILKPFDERELRTVIEMALYKHDAETRLRESELKLRTIVEHSTQLFYSHTPANVLTYVSPQCREFLDCEPEEALRDWQEFLTDHPANAEGVALARAAVETGQRQRPYQLELRTQRGRICWVEVRESPVVVDGRTVAIVGALTDITGSKRAQDQLRFQGSALSAAANAIVITNSEGSIVWVNDAFSALTGYELAEALGKNPRDLVKSGQTESAVYEDLWTTIRAGRVWRGDLINRRKDGSFYPEEQTITPVRDDRGEITHFIAIKQDLTERKAVDEMVQASRRHFQAVFEQAAVGMVITDGPPGNFRNVNRRFCEMLGYSAEELRHLSSHEITHADDVAGDAAASEKIATGLIPSFSREKRYRRKDGSYMWARAFVAPLDPSEAKPTLRIGVIEDITARKEAEESLRASDERYIRQRDALIALTGPQDRAADDLAALRQITEISARTLGVARVSIWRYTADRSAIHCLDLYERAADRHSSGQMLSGADYPAYFSALQNVHVIDVPDAQHDPRTSEFTKSYLCPLRITSMLDASIRIQGLTDGVLCHEATEITRSWHPDEHTFAAALANLASLALVEAQRRAAEHALRDTERKLRAIVEHSNQVFYTRTPDDVLTYVSPQARQLLDCEPGEAMRCWPEFLTDHPGNAIGIALARTAIETGRPQRLYELELRTKGGRTCWVEVRESPVVIDGQTVAIAGALTDITERKQAEEALRQQTADLRASNEKLVRFNQATVGRELRMIELKQELNELCARLGEPLRYAIRENRAAAPAAQQEQLS